MRDDDEGGVVDCTAVQCSAVECSAVQCSGVGVAEADSAGR